MNKQKILYVEDEGSLAKIVKESLESRGFEVAWEEDGRQALERLHVFEPDICVLDVMLPKMDGFELAKHIRNARGKLPIIFLTAKTQPQEVIEGFKLGGNDYIRKPFSLEELIARINNLLNLVQGAKATTANPLGQIQIGTYEFHPNTHELKWKEESKQLSHREAEVLKLLCEHKNFTLNRKDLLLKVWGDDSFFNSRNLDVYITRLRDYLKHDPAIKIITLKGTGYRFVVENE